MASSNDRPLYTFQYEDPQGWGGVLVIDRLVNGCAAGGVRVTPHVDADEVQRLARGMTLKSASLGLGIGGAKVGVRTDPRAPNRMDRVKKFFEQIRFFCETNYGFGPDINTTSAEVDEVAEHLKLGFRLGVLAPDQDREAAAKRYNDGFALPYAGSTIGDMKTAIGALAAVEEAAAQIGAASPRVAIQGFGAVGATLGQLVVERGFSLVGVSDAGGAYLKGDGLDVAALRAAVDPAKRVVDRAKLPPGVEVVDNTKLLALPCDVLVLAATKDAIHTDNVGAVQARAVVEAGNIGVTADALVALHRAGVPVVPDFVASAGAITMACGTIRLGFDTKDPDKLADQIGSRIRQAVKTAFEAGRERNVPLRGALLDRMAERI